jgi:hypothetical protein
MAEVATGMLADSPSVPRRKNSGSSWGTNGSTLLPGVDGRSSWARRARDIIAAHISDLGGVEGGSEVVAVSGQFTEGFGLADLQDAKTLMKSLRRKVGRKQRASDVQNGVDKQVPASQVVATGMPLSLVVPTKDYQLQISLACNLSPSRFGQIFFHL